MNTPNTSDKTVVGSRVAADKSMEEEDTGDSCVARESRASMFAETGIILCAVDDAIRAVIGI